MKENLRMEISAMLRTRTSPDQAVALLADIIGQIVANAPGPQRRELHRLALSAIDKALMPRSPESPDAPSAP